MDPALSASIDRLSIASLLVCRRGQLLHANPAACDLLGYKTYAALRDDWTETQTRLGIGPGVLPPNVPSVRLPHHYASGGGHRLIFELEIHRVTGSKHEGGNLIFIHNKTRLHRVEEELVLAGTMHTVPLLLSNYRHTSASVLNALQLTLELLIDTVNSREVLTDQRENLIRYTTSLKNDLSRLHAGLSHLTEHKQQSQEPDSINVTELLQEIINTLEQQLRLRRVTVKLSLPENTIAVHGFRNHIGQAIYNLIFIFLDITKPGSCLSITATNADQLMELTMQVNNKPEQWTNPSAGNFFSLWNVEHSNDIHFYVARAIILTTGGHLQFDDSIGDTLSCRLWIPTRAESTIAKQRE
jgi:signal transduction histidine kinase